MYFSFELEAADMELLMDYRDLMQREQSGCDDPIEITLDHALRAIIRRSPLLPEMK